MSIEIVHKIADVATTSAVDACWRQWRALGFPASATQNKEPTSIIDPEALVLLSTEVARHERRLEDALAWWARTASTLLSVQRASSLLRTFPPSTCEAFSLFAVEAYDAGDRRWKRYVGKGMLAEGRRTKGPGAPTLTSPTALMLRLRAGFGVGVKTDLLTYLLGRRRHGATIKEAHNALFYTAPALRTAATEMALAALIRPDRERPVRYVADLGLWRALAANQVATTLAEQTNAILPVWYDWARLFAFLADVLVWAERAQTDGGTPYILSSRARDLVLPRLSTFTSNQIDVPDPKIYKGEAYLEGFKSTVEAVTHWLTYRL